MAVSDSVAAGIGVACAVFTFIVTFPIALWLRNWFLRSLEPDPPNPFAHEIKLVQSSELIRNAICPTAERFNWDGSKEIRRFAAAVDRFVQWYLRGDGTQGDAPYDNEKLRSLAGGSFDDAWDNLDKLGESRRQHAIVHFICRVLYLRMIPDGDCSITLLPADMLSTYQRMLTKRPPVGWLSEDVEDRKRSLTMLRQHWRALTTFCISEPYWELKEAEESGSRKPNALAVRWYEGATVDPKMGDDDPRMPRLLAVEALLKDALDPFWDPNRQQGEPGIEKRLECAGAQELLREVTSLGADLALQAFSQIEPVEFYWPSTTRREAHDPYGNGGYLHCFGVRQRKPSPGIEQARYKQVVTTQIIMGPIYNDTLNLIHHLFYIGPEKFGTDWRKACQLRDSKNGAETEAEKLRRERLERTYTGLLEYSDYHTTLTTETPGWDGATNFF